MPFMECGGSLLCLQELAAVPDPEADESIPHFKTVFLR
jgi:hypothetical protein